MQKRPAKEQPTRTRPSKEGSKQALPALRGDRVREATSPDTMLLVGGLALFILVLCDTVFLTLSTRYLRAG